MKTQDIMDFFKQAGNPKPKFIESIGSFTVILSLKEPIGGHRIKAEIKLTIRQQEILKLIRTYEKPPNQ